MNYEYVLVEVWIPAANQKSDIEIPKQMLIGQFMKLLQKILPEIDANIFELQASTRLYRYDTLEELDLSMSFEKYHIEIGETLLLL